MAARKPDEKHGKPIKLKHGRRTRTTCGICVDHEVLKTYLKQHPLVPFELRIVTEHVDGKSVMRAYLPDGVEIENFNMTDNDQKGANQVLDATVSDMGL